MQERGQQFSSQDRAAIIGGDGNMGRLTQRLFENVGIETIVSDVKLPQSPTPTEAIRGSQIVFFSLLPIDEIPKVLAATDDVINDTHIVMDNASVKAPLIVAFKELDARGVSVCSTHPLCKHDQPLHGQKALAMGVGQNSQRARTLAETLYRKAGMVVIPLEFEKHDQNMMVMQLVPHLIMRSVAEALASSDVDLNTLRKIAPANFQLFNLSMWRTLVQDPRISATIISKLLKQDGASGLVGQILVSIGESALESDEAKLSKTFGDTFAKLDQDSIANEMNLASTTVLERLANLEVESLRVVSPVDRVGVLEKLAGTFARQGISLNALDSHKSNGEVAFRIGIVESTSSPKAIAKVVTLLGRKGFRVEEITTPKD